MSNKILWLDTETTGLDPVKQDVIQIAGIIEIDGVVEKQFEFKCQPHSWDSVQQQALDVHGYSVADLRTFESPHSVKAQVEALLSRYVSKFDKTDKFILAGYNVGFDARFMKQWWLKAGDKYWGSFVEYKNYDIYPLFQTFSMAMELDIPNHKLVTAAAYFGYEFGAHDALEDIRVTRLVGKDLGRIFKLGCDAYSWAVMHTKRRELMKQYKSNPVDQNCLQCCVAGLFDLELSDVPNVAEFGEKGYWFDEFYEWCKEELKHIPIAVTDDTMDDLYNIEVYERPNGIAHAIICKGIDVVWDPLPEPIPDEIRTTEYKFAFVPIGGLTLQNACRISHVDLICKQQAELNASSE